MMDNNKHSSGAGTRRGQGVRTVLLALPFLATVGVAPETPEWRPIALALICVVGTFVGYHCGRIEESKRHG